MRAALAVVICLCAGCPSTLPKYDYAKEPNPTKAEVVLGVGDVVGINVWENANLNTEGTIRPDGRITMPLVGDLDAAGKTPTELKELIKKEIAKYIKLQGGGNEITVAVRSWKSYRFTIQGEVSRTGVFTSDQYLTVSEALAMAGGLTRFAKRGEITLWRKDGKGETRHIPLDYESLASGTKPLMNIYVLPGDTIWVP